MEARSGLTFVVPAPLRLFLPAKRRGAEAHLPVDGTSTVGHLLAAAGIPKTEVAELLLDGRAVDHAYRPQTGDRIEVVEVRRPQPAPTDPPRFVLDVHLGTLARRMRLLGIDTAYSTQATDDELLATSLDELRVLLTRDRGLLHRRALRWGAYIYADDPDAQLRDLLDRFAPPVRPWTRCPACNGLLGDVLKSEIEDLLPAGTRRTYDTFQRCSACGKLYWHGAHGERLKDIVDRATG